jgi:hypothetical protein
MAWDVLVMDAPETTDIHEIMLAWPPPPFGKRADIIKKICALYPQADFSGDPSSGTLRLPDGSIEFSLGDDEEICYFTMHVSGGVPTAEVVAHILDELGLRAFDTPSETGPFDHDPESGLKGAH